MAGLVLSNEMRSPFTPEAVKKILATILAPPILTHNRPSMERYIQRIQNVLPYSLQLQFA